MRRDILMKQSKDGIVILDQDGGVYETNKSFADMLGYSMEELQQLHVWDWEFCMTREQLGMPSGLWTIPGTISSPGTGARMGRSMTWKSAPTPR